MFPLLDRDFLKSFLQAFVTAMALAFVLTLVNELLDYYRYIFGTGESKLGFVLLYYVMTLPDQASFMLPLATSASILWVLLTKARENEILAYFACGVGPTRLARPFLLCAAIISSLGLFLSESVVGPANAKAYRIEKIHIKNRKETTVTQQSDIVLGLKDQRVGFVDSFDDKFQRMEDAAFIDKTADGRGIRQKVEIEEGVLTESGWMLSNVTIQKFDDHGNVIESVTHPKIAGSQIDPPIEPSLVKFLSATQNPDRMTYRELRSYLELQAEQGKKRNPKWETDLHLKLAVPMVSLILALLMCAHAIRPSSSGVMKSFGGGLVWMAVVTAVQMGLRKLGDSGVISAVLAAWLPMVIFGILGTFLLTRPRFA